MKLPCLDEAGGEGSSGQQAMVPGMPQGNWQVGRLNRRLGAGRVDPFGAYPVETQPYMHELLDHCTYYYETFLYFRCLFVF